MPALPQHLSPSDWLVSAPCACPDLLAGSPDCGGEDLHVQTQMVGMRTECLLHEPCVCGGVCVLWPTFTAESLSPQTKILQELLTVLSPSAHKDPSSHFKNCPSFMPSVLN